MAFTTSSSQAVSIPDWERPLYTAQLDQVAGPLVPPTAMQLTLNKRDGASRPTTFTLVEDTGIRCITTPCPSERTSLFRVVSIVAEGRVVPGAKNVTRYMAMEMKVRRPRVLRVLETSKRGQPLFWEVSVRETTRPLGVKQYQRNPEVVYSIMRAE